MKRIFAVVLVFVLALALCTVAYAADKPADTLSSVEKEFKATFPKFTVDSFKEGPLKGLYEVQAGPNIIYYSPEGYLIFGEIYGKDGHSLTQDRKTAIMAEKVGSLPLDKAFKMGHGKNVVIEVTDPDCPYCRKASEFLSKRTDITRYVYFFPLRQLHPNAERHATYILAKNNAAAYQEVYSGALDNKNTELSSNLGKTGGDKLKEQEGIVGKLGVKGTPVFFVNGHYVNGANIPELEKLLGGKENAEK